MEDGRLYFKTRDGVIKIFQMITSLVAFGLSCCVPYYGIGWTTFVTVCAFVMATAWFFLHTLKTLPPLFVRYRFEPFSSLILSIFLFVAAIVAFAGYHYHVHITVVLGVFCLFTFCAFLAETVLSANLLLSRSGDGLEQST